MARRVGKIPDAGQRHGPNHGPSAVCKHTECSARPTIAWYLHCLQEASQSWQCPDTQTHTLITSVSDGLRREGNELQDTMEQRASRRKGRESEE